MIGVRLPFESVAKHAQILSVLVQQGEDGAFVTRNTPQAGKNRRNSFSNSRLALNWRLMAARLCCSSKARPPLCFSSVTAPSSAMRERTSTSSAWSASATFLPSRPSQNEPKVCSWEDRVRSNAMIAQHRHTAVKALFALRAGMVIVS